MFIKACSGTVKTQAILTQTSFISFFQIGAGFRRQCFLLTPARFVVVANERVFAFCTRLDKLAGHHHCRVADAMSRNGMVFLYPYTDGLNRCKLKLDPPDDMLNQRFDQLYRPSHFGLADLVNRLVINRFIQIVCFRRR